MLFHKFLRALLEAWGHKPKGTTVWELLKEVWQNLPFGVKTEMVEIMPKQNAEIDYISDEYANGFVDMDSPEYFIENETYIVNFDGKDYNCKTFIVDTGDDFYYCLGNGDIFMGHSSMDAPFIIYTSREMPKLAIYTRDNEVCSHTISISQQQEVVTPLDPKFVGGSRVVTYTRQNNVLYLEDKEVTFFDIQKEWEAGSILRIRDKGINYYFCTITGLEIADTSDGTGYCVYYTTTNGVDSIQWWD